MEGNDDDDDDAANSLTAAPMIVAVFKLSFYIARFLFLLANAADLGLNC